MLYYIAFLRGPRQFCLVLCLFLTQGLSAQKPRASISLPAHLQEVSGLYLQSPDSLWWHNDSGDSPTLTLTDGNGRILKKVDIPGARHLDWEDITADEKGYIYIGDFGDNRERRPEVQIYRYHPPSGQIDSIVYRYRTGPGESGLKSFNVEGFFWYAGQLHIFTKDRLQKSKFMTRHFVLPDTPGNREASLVDSLVLGRKVVTAAAIHPASRTMVLLAYKFKKFLGFLPISAASIYIFRNFSGQNFLRGDMSRKKIACLIPTQFEAIDFIDHEYLYVASEKTPLYRHKAKRKRWSKSSPAVTN